MLQSFLKLTLTNKIVSVWPLTYSRIAIFWLQKMPARYVHQPHSVTVKNGCKKQQNNLSISLCRGATRYPLQSRRFLLHFSCFLLSCYDIARFYRVTDSFLAQRLQSRLIDVAGRR